MVVKPLDLLTYESVCRDESLRKMPGACQRPFFFLISYAPKKFVNLDFRFFLIVNPVM